MNNLDHLKELDAFAFANTFANISKNLCAYCNRGLKPRCDERCAHGLLDWLLSWYNPNDSIWKVGKKQ